MEFVVADAEALPFPNGTFDAFTCRFGLCCFSLAQCALREMRRMLRPAGHAALITWGPFELNPYWSAGSAVLRRPWATRHLSLRTSFASPTPGVSR
jgi:ubiquinone/menaquinone biosynthesis C-methylase UbiE